jgi:hypothetical protein
MADETLRTINDIINMYNGNVGVGTSVPQNLLHIEGGIYTYQLGNMNSNIDMQQTVLANAKSLYASTIVTTPRIASLTSNIDLTYSTLTNINTIAVDNLTAVTNGNIYFSGKSLSNIENMYVSKDVFISGSLRASNLEIFGETTLLQTTTCNTDQFTITNYNTGPALVVTQQGTTSPVATFRSASGTDPALFINNTGWVGLGTETVNSQLHVWDTASATVDTIEIIEATNAARQAQLKLQNVQTNATLTALTSGTVTLANNGAFPLTLGTNGTDKIRIDSAGNVGVGTNSAAYGIHLYNASAPVAEQIQTGGAFTASLNMKNTASQFSIDTTTTSTSLSNVNAFPLTFGTSATERVRIDAAGNVGMGTTSPAFNLHMYRVATAATEQIETAGAFNATLNLVNNASTFGIVTGTTLTSLTNTNALPLTFGTAATEIMRIDGTGNIGIGTNAPAYDLHLYETSRQITEHIQTAGAFNVNLNMVNNASQFSINATTTSTSLSNVNAFPLTFGTTATERMRIDAIGNVGIGTTSPIYDLHLYELAKSATEQIESGGAFNANLNMVNNASQFSINATTTSTSLSNVNAFPLTFGTTATERMRIAANGNIGIGSTTPAYFVDIYGPAGTTPFSASNNSYTVMRNIVSIQHSGYSKYSFNINRVLGAALTASGGTTQHTFLYTISWTNAVTAASLPIRIETNLNVAENSTPSSYWRKDTNIINPNTRLVLGTGVNQAIASGTVLVAGTTPISFANSTTTATQVTHGFGAKSGTTPLALGRIYVSIDVYAPSELGDFKITYVNFT